MALVTARFAVRPLPPARTRALRRAVLRPHETIEQLAVHEPPGAFAVGAFAGGTLVAVGLIGREGRPGAWRVREWPPPPRRVGTGRARRCSTRCCATPTGTAPPACGPTSASTRARSTAAPASP